MAFKIEIGPGDDVGGYRSWNTMKVTHHGEVLAEYHDSGEPEDNSFLRDYKWIKPLLEQAYERGREDGHEDGYQNGFEEGRNYERNDHDYLDNN